MDLTEIILGERGAFLVMSPCQSGLYPLKCIMRRQELRVPETAVLIHVINPLIEDNHFSLVSMEQRRDPG